MILVSYCKLGLKCTYKATSNSHLSDSVFLTDLFKRGMVIGVCPEVFGGLTTPRDPSEIKGGNGFDVIEGRAGLYSCKGVDVTRNFILGAEMCVDIAEKYGVKAAVLNECSPACGVNCIYDGTFTRTKIKGPGVLGAMLAARFGPSFKIIGTAGENERSFLLNFFDNR